ncbi:hypothetical protein QUB80_25925 [Chlorogloeopsis sp. ULAP01]|uniref:hypothetical protein n=1 Tax=Chlorogloeopsis sp. ULAP01 TaxID=3056483 RepID=UPI0025AAF25A|nr:hypothetical protein [Chlorogloeopsis sp. ULAP01]MDM9384118.1 hypothetical protein [Chlorogloeopsis sp. ULAP01]
MSNIDKMLESTSANQDLFVDLNKKDAEALSGGALERFTISNRTNARIPYSVDGSRLRYLNPGSVASWATTRGGIVAFDYDVRPGVQLRRRNLSNGRYTFLPDTRTSYRGDIDIFRIA